MTDLYAHAIESMQRDVAEKLGAFLADGGGGRLEEMEAAR
jgi:hypothetical protein